MNLKRARSYVYILRPEKSTNTPQPQPESGMLNCWYVAYDILELFAATPCFTPSACWEIFRTYRRWSDVAVCLEFRHLDPIRARFTGLNHVVACLCHVFLWISWDTSTPSTPEPAVERHQKFWPHMPSCMRVSQHFCLSQWFPVVSRSPILWSLDVRHDSVGKHIFFCLLTSMLFQSMLHIYFLNWKSWVVFRLKDTPNYPHQMTWPLPRCHSSIETGEGSVSVGVRAPSAGVLAATSVNRTVEPSQMCLCVFAESTIGHQKCFVGPWLSFFACALVQLHGGVGRGSASGSAMGHPGFSLVPSFCLEPAEWSTRSSGTCQELKFGFKQSTSNLHLEWEQPKWLGILRFIWSLGRVWQTNG